MFIENIPCKLSLPPVVVSSGADSQPGPHPGGAGGGGRPRALQVTPHFTSFFPTCPRFILFYLTLTDFSSFFLTKHHILVTNSSFLVHPPFPPLFLFKSTPGRHPRWHLNSSGFTSSLRLACINFNIHSIISKYPIKEKIILKIICTHTGKYIWHSCLLLAWTRGAPPRCSLASPTGWRWRSRGSTRPG